MALLLPLCNFVKDNKHASYYSMITIFLKVCEFLWSKFLSESILEIIISNSNKSFFYLKALGWIQLIWFPVKFARIKCLKFSTIPMSSLVKDDREMCKYLSAKTYQLKDCYFEGERVCVSNQTFVQIGRRGRFIT